MSKVQSLTPASVDALRAGRMADPRTPGLFVEVSAAGAKVWKYRRRVARGTTFVKMTLGSFPAFSVADARDWAAPINLAVERGEDPREAIKAKAAIEALTVEHCHGLYMACVESGKWRTLKPRTIKDKRYIFDSEIKPAIGAKSIFDVTTNELWELVEEKAESAPVRANRLAAELKVFFGWCASRDAESVGIVLDRDPAMKLSGNRYKQGEGERWLDEDEIMLFLRAIAVEDRLYRRALALLLLTGCRKSEVMGAPASEISGGVWTIPPERTKNSKLHRIVLGPWGRALAMTNTEWLIQQSGARGRGGDGPMMSGWYKIRDRVHARMEALAGHSIEHWSLHDLRRTMRSHVEDLGVRENAAEAMMNHMKKGLVKIYNRKEAPGKQEGFALWEAYLSKLARRAKVAERLEIPVTKRKA